MENIIYYSLLYDYYKDLFTDIQKKYFEDYYFNNFSLSEIATNYSVSKNAIAKTITGVTNKLEYYEEKLHLNNNKDKIKELLKNNSDLLEKLEDYI